MRYFLRLSYDGTEYAGWQRQPNVETVQGAIEQALSTLLKTDIVIMGCGRTDSGVHARNYIAHCDLDIEDGQVDHIIYKLNRLTKSDIACHELIPVDKNAHARYDAYSRTYYYDIHIKKSPFLGRYSTYIPYGHKLDHDMLDEVVAQIIKMEDFSSFCKAHGSDTSMTCALSEAYWVRLHNGGLRFVITSNRFLRGMVRLIVGTSLSAASGQLSMNDLLNHLAKGTRSPVMRSAPAEGLALTSIKYPYLSITCD